MVYLVCGKARAGKNTASNFIKGFLEEKNHKVCQIELMRAVKGYAKDFFGWDGKEETKPRELLQNLGTEIIRLKLNKPLFHIDRISEDIEVLSEYFDTFIIDDVRLPIEIETIKERFNAISILIKRDVENNLTDKEKNHITETSLDNYQNVDYIIENNKTLEELKEKIKEVVIQNEIYDK